MSQAIAAIPTLYNGIQFRSRLEAKWASFFDALGLRWEYEPLDLNGWIPDFLVYPWKGQNFRLLIEVKPLQFTEPSQETINKISRALNIPDRTTDQIGYTLYFAFQRYKPVIVGAWPSIYGLHCYWGNPVDESKIGLGWTPWSEGDWRVEFDMLPGSPTTIQKAWKKATNRSQWRAPK